jgi:ribosomal protein S18 acetylase RimI-like enzyme
MIRQAEIKDFDQIKAIENDLTIKIDQLKDLEYRISVQKNGFLITNEFTKEIFTEQIKNIFPVMEIDGEIAGYLRVVDFEPLFEPRKSIIYNEDFAKFFLTKPHAYIDRLAVKSTFRKKGIAHELLNYTEQELIKKGINRVSSFVVVSPVTNTSSIIIHEKLGFERIDISIPFEFAGFKKYQSFWYGKKL